VAFGAPALAIGAGRLLELAALCFGSYSVSLVIVDFLVKVFLGGWFVT